MGGNYQMTNSCLDGFVVSVTRKESILAGKHYPLGYFAVQYLELNGPLWREIDQRAHTFREEFEVFLSAHDPSSAAVAQQALNDFWEVLKELPVYQDLGSQRGGVEGVLHDLRGRPDTLEAMLTPGTVLNNLLHEWLGRITGFAKSILDFENNTCWMLDEYFVNLPARKSENYAAAFAQYRQDTVRQYEMEFEEYIAERDRPEPQGLQLSFPVQVSFGAEPVPNAPEKFVLAESFEFRELAGFLHYDLCRGMAAGNLPRRCDCCGHYFLAIGAYDTRYCSRIAPGETVKTCRQVGAHRKEKQRNGTEFVRKEYQKVYNRLKGRKNRGIISGDEWNQQVARIQELKAQALAGKVEDIDLKRQFEQI